MALEPKAKILIPKAAVSTQELVQELGISPPKAVIIAPGHETFEGVTAARLHRLFSEVVVGAANLSGGLLLDNGANQGVCLSLDEGTAERGSKTILIGVAPESQVSVSATASSSSKIKPKLAPNHTHFVLTEGDQWGDETSVLVGLAAEIARNSSVLTVLAGGDETSKTLVLNCIRRAWPVVLIEGSGGLTDKIIGLYRDKLIKNKEFGPGLEISVSPISRADATLIEIVTEGDLHLLKLSEEAAELQQLISSLLTIRPDDILRRAWEQQRLYSYNAARAQRSYNRFRQLILILGLLTSLVAVAQTALSSYSIALNFISSTSLSSVLQTFLLLASLFSVVLVTGINFFKPDLKWGVLRASSEAIKREIFLYRTRTGNYFVNVFGGGKAGRDRYLAQQLEAINRYLSSSTAFSASLILPRKLNPIPTRVLPDGSIDDGLSLLNPIRYLTLRVDDQLDYYRKKAAQLERQLVRFQSLIIMLGSISTVLAAIQLNILIPLVVVFSNTFALYLESNQTADIIQRYNRITVALIQLRAWWTALSSDEQAQEVNVSQLVHLTEATLQSEQDNGTQPVQFVLRSSQLQSSDSETLKEEPKVTLAVQPKSSANLESNVVGVINPSRVLEATRSAVQQEALPLLTHFQLGRQAGSVIDEVFTLEGVRLEPYRGLVPYEEEDAPFFFGRETQQEIISANLIAARLTLLYGPSGVGKSSILQAGVVHELRQQARQNLEEWDNPEFVVIYFTGWKENPVESLLRSIKKAIDDLWPYRIFELEYESTLDATLAKWTKKLRCDFLIILDQFEEYFLYHPNEDGSQTFATDFPRTVNRSGLGVNFLISIREDALAKLDRFKGHIPNLFNNYLRVERLKATNAYDAIKKPLKIYNALLISLKQTKIDERIQKLQAMLEATQDFAEKQALQDQLNKLEVAKKEVYQEEFGIDEELVETVLAQVQADKLAINETGRGGRIRASGGKFRVEIEAPYLQLVMTRL